MILFEKEMAAEQGGLILKYGVEPTAMRRVKFHADIVCFYLLLVTKEEWILKAL